MNKIIITEEGKSNLPVVIITFNTADSVIDYWKRTLVDNPGKYSVEIVSKFTFTENCGESFEKIFGGLCIAYELHGKLSKEHELNAFFSTMNGLSYAEERFKRISEIFDGENIDGD